VSNLLENALRHGDPGPVELSCSAAEDLQLAVRNNGRIPTELAETLFDRFARSRNGGHGLGLALVDAIARVHGGSTFVRTQHGVVEIGFALTATAVEGR
jgi:two-component system heavy metal sensor histidine kinase CusS